MTEKLSPDAKGQASLIFAEVVAQTRHNFFDPRYHPQVYLDTPQYPLYGIDPSPYQIWVSADGIGTKPELAERLSDPNFFESLAFDTFAMVDGDEARFGRFLLGVADILDVNTADPAVILALAKGAKKACDQGGFALLNGETAELGYRVCGYGATRINWNVVGVSLVVPEKLILGADLRPGQTIVAFQETSLRSNGLTKARAILEAAYLHALGYPSKKEYLLEHLGEFLSDAFAQLGRVREKEITNALRNAPLVKTLSNLLGHDFLEQMLIPWHELDPEVVKEILKPSTLYGRIIQDALGRIEGRKQVNIVAAAHITGGGIPEKIKRMVELRRLGAHIEPVFDDPRAIKLLLTMAEEVLPAKEAEKIIDDRKACETWNRGIGFVAVLENKEDVESLYRLGQKYGVSTVCCGQILSEPKIEWRGHTWTY